MCINLIYHNTNWLMIPQYWTNKINVESVHLSESLLFLSRRSLVWAAVMVIYRAIDGSIWYLSTVCRREIERLTECGAALKQVRMLLWSIIEQLVTVSRIISPDVDDRTVMNFNSFLCYKFCKWLRIGFDLNCYFPNFKGEKTLKSPVENVFNKILESAHTLLETRRLL